MRVQLLLWTGFVALGGVNAAGVTHDIDDNWQIFLAAAWIIVAIAAIGRWLASGTRIVASREIGRNTEEVIRLRGYTKASRVINGASGGHTDETEQAIRVHRMILDDYGPTLVATVEGVEVDVEGVRRALGEAYR